MDTPITWNKTERGLMRSFEFVDFDEAMRFINRVADKAREMDHHPEIRNSYNKVTLTLFTHDANAITEKDVALAKAIDTL